MAKRKCVECGFLTIKNYDSKQLDFFDEAWRKSGSYPGDNPYSGPPICFAGAKSFREEDGKIDRNRISNLITEKWECPEFMDLRGCLSARDHWDMRHAEIMEKLANDRRQADQRFEEEVRERNRKFDEAQRERDRVANEKRDEQSRIASEKRDEQQREFQKQQRKQDRVWQVFVPLLAAAFGIGLTKWLSSPPHEQTPPIIEVQPAVQFPAAEKPKSSPDTK